MSKPTIRESINENCPLHSPLNLSTKVMVRVICISIAVFALVATGWTSTRSETLRQPSDPWVRFLAPATGKILVDANIPPDYAPIAVVRIDDELFEKVELQNSPKAVAPGPGGGSAEVFDPNGRLLRRFTAVERANSTWEVVEYIRLSAHASTPPAAAPTIEPITTRQQSQASDRR